MWESIGANNTIIFICWIMRVSLVLNARSRAQVKVFLQLTAWLSEHTGAAASETIGVVLETSSGPVVECGQASGYTMYAMNPKQADRYRDRFSPAGAKDDRRDALVLATALYLEPQVLRRLERPENPSIELRDRWHMRQNLTQLQLRLILQMQKVFWRYYPQFETLFGSDLALPFVAALRHRMPNAHQAQRTRKSMVAAILKKYHIRRFDAQQMLAQLSTQPLPVPVATEVAAQEYLTLLWQQLTLVNHQLQELEQQLIATLENLKTNSATSSATSLEPKLQQQKPSDCDILASIPGIDKMVLATLLEEAAPAIQNRDYAALRCSTRIAPVTKRSGKSCRVQRRRAANPRLADTMYL